LNNIFDVVQTLSPLHETTPYLAVLSKQFCAAQAKATLLAAAWAEMQHRRRLSGIKAQFASFSLFCCPLRNIKETDGRKVKNAPL
jgi:hypothetical protein